MTDGFRTNGDWSALIQARLQNAMRASMAQTGRSASGITIRAVIHMTKAASARTKRGVKTRPVQDNPGFRHLLTPKGYQAARQRGERMSDYYRFTADKLNQPPRSLTAIYGNDKKELKKIKRVGLAKSSWAWGLRKLNRPAAATQKEMAGVVDASKIVQGHIETGGTVGHQLTNRLSYVTTIMGAGWEDAVVNSATNKILKIDALELAGKSKSAMERGFAGARAAA